MEKTTPITITITEEILLQKLSGLLRFMNQANTFDSATIYCMQGRTLIDLVRCYSEYSMDDINFLASEFEDACRVTYKRLSQEKSFQ